MKNPFGAWTVRAATAMVPTTAAAASGVAAPASTAAPAPVSTTALAAAWSFGSRKPMEENHRAVPSSERPCLMPWATIVLPIAARRTRRAAPIPFTTVRPPSFRL